MTQDANGRIGHAQTDRAEAKAGSRFWDRVADKYARQPIADEEAYQEKLRITRQYLSPDARVWEFGCGTGTTALAHAAHAGHIEATDISARMIEIAEGKAREQGVGNVTFRQSSAEDYAAAPGTFDMVMAHSVLHLLEDRTVAIARAHDALRRGGVFVSSTFCAQDELPVLKYVAPLARLAGLMPRLAFFTADELAESMRSVGFGIERRWRPDGKRKAVFIVARKP